MNTTVGRRRYAVVGTGNRAQLYVDALLTTHADVGTPVAWCDVNAVRMSYYDDRYRAVHGDQPAPRRYGPDDFAALLAEVRPDGVIVTSPDWTHHRYVVAALEHGCDVVVEKPLTTSAGHARAIARAAEASAARAVLTFNYRYSPRNTEVRRLIASGAVGDVTSVHFEWLLDTAHGADYFRRWHREKAKSGGLLVHKATHHFDLANWWLDDVPATVFALGGLRFYGARRAEERGLGPRPARSRDDPGRADDPFALDLGADDTLRRLYLEAEGDDGYLRDQDVFGEGITIEDNLSVLVGYERGASMTYSLNAHAPWEGYRVAVNGTAGRLELEVVETAHQAAGPGADAVRAEGDRIVLQRHWERAVEVPVPPGAHGPHGHGGGDALLLDDLFRGPGDDPLRRPAGLDDGFRSIAVGLAANESLATGRPVRVASLGLPLGPR
ncbi:Gfo/Idh/MocA family protein [Jiangella alba]|uniref:Oxidoreductase family, NAD-binding Rossmann fold n=1 Tax=Jiangella alba TaxID=561176 RepID=A0A1H5L1R5_9ACTN|nr:Gfo/Idh/MocA family oxidoreductase [Jiangella alba]SEE71022.1 Oxidoreductase family, NAD-binding Rossmann fold [Jiangella alba]